MVKSKITNNYTEGRPKLSVPHRRSEHTTESTSVDTSTSERTHKTHRLKFTKKSIRIITVSVGALVIVGLGTTYYIDNQPLARAPAYQTVLPNSKSINQLGGWQRISPPKESPIFAYADSINGVAISVSQQPLPESFKENAVSQIAEIARQGYYSTKIAAGTTVVYVGTSVKGPQSAILTKNGLLIFIKSQQKIDDAAWATYVESLK